MFKVVFVFDWCALSLTFAWLCSCGCFDGFDVCDCLYIVYRCVFGAGWLDCYLLVGSLIVCFTCKVNLCLSRLGFDVCCVTIDAGFVYFGLVLEFVVD